MRLVFRTLTVAEELFEGFRLGFALDLGVATALGFFDLDFLDLGLATALGFFDLEFLDLQLRGLGRDLLDET